MKAKYIRTVSGYIVKVESFGKSLQYYDPESGDSIYLHSGKFYNHKESKYDMKEELTQNDYPELYL